jgi:hypothetical protein
MIEGHDYAIYSNGPTGRSRMYAFLALITAFLAPLAQHAALIVLRRYWGTTGTSPRPRCSLAASQRWSCTAF